MGMSSAERSRRYRLKNPEKVKATKEAFRARHRVRIREYDAASAVATRLKRRQWLDAYKVAAGCADCGYDAHPRALDFDHIGTDKEGNVGLMAHGRIAWPRLMAEIAKCEVVCSNCHRVRTWRREQVEKPEPVAPDQLDLFSEEAS